jgi:hypothetical protein
MDRLCERYLSIDINNLRRSGIFFTDKVWSRSWSRNGDPIGEVHVASAADGVLLLAKVPGLDSSEKSEKTAQGVRVTWMPCRFGGRRPWFVCPVTSCGRKCAKLYLGRGFFACRECHRLAYASQREPVRERGLHKARKIRASLGGGANVFETFPDRPQGMHRARYQRLRAAHDRAADRCMLGLSALASKLDRKSRPAGSSA